MENDEIINLLNDPKLMKEHFKNNKTIIEIFETLTTFPVEKLKLIKLKPKYKCKICEKYKEFLIYEYLEFYKKAKSFYVAENLNNIYLHFLCDDCKKYWYNFAIINKKIKLNTS